MISDDVAGQDRTVDDWRESKFFQLRPSMDTLAWVAASMGKGSRIAGYRRLTGGANSAVHRLTVERHDTRTFVVLRQYPPGSVALQTAMEKEIANLEVVAGSQLPVPSILAADVAGLATGGVPSLLMTRLPGHVRLNPAEHRPWIERIAEFAARLHSVDLPAPTFRPWTDSWIAPLGQFHVPDGAQKPAVWQAAFDAMEAPPPEDGAVFLHCDYLPVNLLWSRGKITGLTDWNSIHRGSRAIDVGQCRRYLASLYSPEWAEQLGSIYESIAGATLHPWWDLYTLLHHDNNGPKSICRQVAGRRPVDVSGMTARVEVAAGTPPSSTPPLTTTTSPAPRGHSPPPKASNQEWKLNRRPGHPVTYPCSRPERAYPSGEESPLNLGSPYMRRFEETVSTGINYPLVNSITQFSTGTVVELKFRGWDTCLSATNVQLCATSDG